MLHAVLEGFSETDAGVFRALRRAQMLFRIPVQVIFRENINIIFYLCTNCRHIFIVTSIYMCPGGQYARENKAK